MRIVTLDCAHITTKKELHRALSEVMDFPDWYGNNLDALFDCLTDLEVPTALTLVNWQAAEESLDDYARRALETMQQATEENSDFKLFFQEET